MLDVLKNTKKYAKVNGCKTITYADDVDAITFATNSIITTFDRFNEARQTCRFESRTVGTINERKSRFRMHGYVTYDDITKYIDMVVALSNQEE